MLAIIAERNGDVVTREELRVRLWPAVAIDYKHSLGNSLLEIRKVLNDSVENPLYIKTVPRGYRFLVPVEFIPWSAVNGNGSSNSHTDHFSEEIKRIRRELINTLDFRSLTVLLYRCEGLLNQDLRHPKFPDLQLLKSDIQSAIDRSVVLEPSLANPTISNEVASLVFDDPNAISIPDPLISGGWKTIGLASESVLLTVEHSVYQKNGRRIVLIHRVRRATLEERRVYEQTHE